MSRRVQSRKPSGESMTIAEMQSAASQVSQKAGHIEGNASVNFTRLSPPMPGRRASCRAPTHASATCRLGGTVREGDQVAAGLEAVPDVSAWEGLQSMERERREGILRDIRMRIEECGPRRAVADPARGRLFMPFAALEGYGEMLAEAEGDERRPGPHRPGPWAAASRDCGP